MYLWLPSVLRHLRFLFTMRRGEEVFRDFYHTDVGENVYEFNKGYQIADGNYALVLMNLKNQMAIEPISKYTPPELPDNLEGQDGKSRD